MDDIESRVPIIAKRPRTKTVIVVANQPKIQEYSNPRAQKKPDDKFCIDNTHLSEQGKNRINKARDGLLLVKEVNKNTLPLKGSHVCGCTNINPHTGVLMQTLCELGADVSWCSSNINTVEVFSDDICAAVADFGVSVHAWYGQTEDDYWWCIDECINSACNKPDFALLFGKISTVVNTCDEYYKFYFFENQ
ncbi:hypothetical protein MXB_2635 [Myxobolus squamalis]|nr:hypothetical protein MXB_2635 [Myxobolus squamalis]